jgi:hypothetical protein
MNLVEIAKELEQQASLNGVEMTYILQFKSFKNFIRPSGSRICSTTSAEIPMSHFPYFSSDGSASSSFPEFNQIFNIKIYQFKMTD